MKAAVLREVGKPLQIEDVKIGKPGPHEVLIRTAAAGVCHSDLHFMEGKYPYPLPAVLGHESAGVVEQVGSEVRTVKVGDFVVGSFWASDNTCEICRAGYQAYCVHRVLMGTLGTQSELARIPLADGTLVATPGRPDPDLIPSLMAARIREAAHVDFVADCRRVAAPTLVLTGEEHLDRVVPVGSTRAYATLIPRAEYRTMPHTGHMGLLTQPSVFADVVSGFAHAHHH